MPYQPQSTPPQSTNTNAEISQEFFIRVNDFIEMANRIERRFDVQHALIALLHAFARYNVHGFLQQGDGAYFSREEFIVYMTDLYRRMLNEHLDSGTTDGPAA